MNSRRRFITEPGDQRWLYATPRAAAAGGMLVVLLLVAMIVFTPGERPDVDADHTARARAPSVRIASDRSFSAIPNAQASLFEPPPEGRQSAPVTAPASGTQSVGAQSPLGRAPSSVADATIRATSEEEMPPTF